MSAPGAALRAAERHIRRRYKSVIQEAIAGGTRSEVEKARYRLNKKVSDGVLYHRPGERGGGAGRETAKWFLAAGNQETSGSEAIRKAIRLNQDDPAARQSETGGDSSPLFSDCPLARDPEAQPWHGA